MSDTVRAPSIRDVARLAGVSHQTVSRVLNAHPSVLPATRERVQAAIAELDYRPNHAARSLVTSRSETIGVLSTQTAQFGPATSVQAIDVAAREAGYSVTIVSLAAVDPQSIEAGIRQLQKHAVEGIIVIAPQETVTRALAESSISVPFVTLHSADPDRPHSVTAEQEAASRVATEYMIGLGHRRIHHLAGPQDWAEAAARVAGYRHAMIGAGLEPRPPLVGDWSSESGYRLVAELVSGHDIDAIVAANDQMALGAMRALADAGLTVPGEVSVIGFDDVPEAAYFTPPLTTMRQDFAEVGRRAVAMLLADLRGEMAPSHVAVETELIVRGSTACR